MIKRIKLLIILLIAFTYKGYSQFYFIDDTYENLEVDFKKHKIEVPSKKSFFNLLTIKNPSNKKASFLVNFSYPAGWTFIGLNEQRITLEPNDSIMLPFRASPSVSSKGDIGYTIVASISDLSGNIITNRYSFINVPRKNDVIIKPETRLLYVNPGNTNAEIKISLKNRGNTDENFFLEFFFNNTLTTKGATDNYYQEEVFLRPFTDTIFKLPIALVPKENVLNRRFHRVKIKVSTQDTTYQSSVWVKQLDYKEINIVPELYKMLSVELRLQNMFAKTKPIPSAYIYGNFLLKKGHTINYYFQTYNSNFLEDPYQNSRFLISYEKGGLLTQIGDVSSNFYHNIFGRGINISYTKKHTTVKAIANKSLYSETYNMGVAAKQQFFKAGGFELGSSLSNHTDKVSNSNVNFLEYSNNINKIGHLSLTFLNSLFEDKNLNINKMGFGGLFRYSKNLKNTSVNANFRYFDTNFANNENGKTNAQANIFHHLDNMQYLTAYYSLNNYGTMSLYDTLDIPRQYTNRHEAKVLYNKLLKNNMTFSIGPNYIYNKANKFYYYLNSPFLTHSYYAYSTLKYRTSNGKYFMSLRVRPGVTQVANSFHDYDSLGYSKLWFNTNLAANVNAQQWGFYISYFHGPYSISQQHHYNFANHYSKNLQVMPYLDMFLIKKYLRLTSRLNYTHDITSKLNRVNLSSELIGYIGQTWEMGFLSNFTYMSNIDRVTDQKETYSAAFFEVRLRKDFLINQPRYQYHDLDIVFFKDLDGNRKKSDDEPGVKNVLVSIKQDDKANMQFQHNTSTYFNQIELLSNLKGKIEYKNIPNGYYIIEYYPIGKDKGSFASEESFQKVYLNKNTKIEVPFLENNKIFGKIILKRSKLSNLGSISISNIKITAESTNGKQYSALTKNDGSFLIYVPNVDKYKVKINNIFYENFDLEQNNFEVQLNGYRQFEINFIFKEKKRKINFASNYLYNTDKDNEGIEIVRRTNLSGIVQNATTLTPIKAQIRVVDKEGKLITQTNTNPKTGKYTLSFIAENDLSLEVNANGYWFFAEKLYNDQIITFKNIEKDILLKSITVGSIIPMKTLVFKQDDAQIPITTFPELERLMKVLHKNPNIKIMVHGHADDLEMLENKNENLSLNRAKNVAKYIIANGYNRVSYIGHKNTKPIATNETEEGRKQNRRVEIVVTGK